MRVRDRKAIPMSMTNEQLKVGKRVLERIDEFPTTHNQAQWHWASPEILRDHGGVQISPLTGAIPAIAAVDMHECGTVACLAGHTILSAYELGIPIPLERDATDNPPEEVAGELLGMDEDQAEALFFNEPYEYTARDYLAAAVERGGWDGVLPVSS